MQRGFHPINERGQIRRQELREIADAAGRGAGGQIASAFSFALSVGGDNLATPALPTFIDAAITGPIKADNSYPYQQLIEDPQNFNVWDIPAGALTDAIVPLFEKNNDPNVALNSEIRAWLADSGDHYLFEASGSALQPAGGGGSSATSPVPFTRLQFGDLGNSAQNATITIPYNIPTSKNTDRLGVVTDNHGTSITIQKAGWYRHTVILNCLRATDVTSQGTPTSLFALLTSTPDADDVGAAAYACIPAATNPASPGFFGAADLNFSKIKQSAKGDVLQIQAGCNGAAVFFAGIGFSYWYIEYLGT